MSITHLILTACHHGDQEFYELGAIEHEATPDKLFAALPITPNDHDGHSVCFIVDAWDGEDGIVDDREVPRELAEKLLGADIDTAIANAQERLTGVYRMLGSSKTLPVSA